MGKPDLQFDDFKEDLRDPQCAQLIYDFAKGQIRGLVDYNDEEDVVQEVFYRLTRWPIKAKYNSTRHYFALLKITIRQAVAAYWKHRHSQRNDYRKRRFVSELVADNELKYEFEGSTENVLTRLQINEQFKMVLEKVKTLDEKHRKFFDLRFLQERSHGEVAQALQISARTSYRLESHLRDLLQTHLQLLGI